MAIATLSCTEKGLSEIDSYDVEGNLVSHEMIELGRKLDDPYTVQNMTKALASLYPTKADRIPLEPTDIYVRFLPKNDTQLKEIEAMGIHLIDHPMDYEILKEGDYYHDPELGDQEITWQYAVVPKSFVFPSNVSYEVLDNCYIAENAVTKAEGIDWEEVEKEAFRLTGNADMLNDFKTKGSNGVPSGRICIIDRALSDEPIGVKGVMVSCNCFVKIAHSFTDANGNYSMTKSFSSNPRYRLIYKNSKGFGIGFNLLIIPASICTLGKGTPDGISVTIDEDSNYWMFVRSVVNNAGWDYYNSCKGDGISIKTPPSNLRFWLFRHLASSSCPMLQQGAFLDSSILADYYGEYLWIAKMFLPDITLGLDGKNDYASIYRAAMHEMAHSSHYMQVGNTYWDQYIMYVLKSFVTSGFVTYGVGTEDNHGYCEVGEMWAYYLETMAYRDRYTSSKDVYGTSFWFSPQIFMNLDEHGIDRYKIFAALTDDVIDISLLQDKLKSLYPEAKSTINQAFGRYK